MGVKGFAAGRSFRRLRNDSKFNALTFWLVTLKTWREKPGTW
jgi:hypothetical protein